MQFSIFNFQFSKNTERPQAGFTPSVNGDEAPRPRGENDSASRAGYSRPAPDHPEKIRSARHNTWRQRTRSVASLFQSPQTVGFSSSPSTAGFTLLLATLVASVVLAVGVSIFRLAQKEVILSSIGRESQFAFYAADSAAECALYWDMRYGWFDILPPAEPPAEQVRCAGQPLNVERYGYIATFEYEPNGLCAKVMVTKNIESPHTVIRADGYNVKVGPAGDCDTAITANPRALQRSVEITVH